MHTIDRLFDRCLRPHVRIAGRHVATWWLLGTLGAVAGGASFAVTSPVPIGVGVTVIASNLLAFTLLRRRAQRRYGGSRSVLLENLVLTFLITNGVLMATARWSAAALDSWAIAMTLLVAVGRLGCVSAGCCHGKASAHGPRYPWRLWRDAPPQLAAVRVFPVPLVETALLLILLAAELSLVTAARAGTVAAVFACGYAVIRFWTEFHRGDDRRYWRQLSEAQWLALGLIGVSGLLAALQFEVTWILLAAASSLALATGWFLHPASRGKPRLPPFGRAAIVEVMDILKDLLESTASSGESRVTSRGVRLTCTATAVGHRVEIDGADTGSSALVGYLCRIVANEVAVTWPTPMDLRGRAVTVRAVAAGARTL